MSWDVSIMKFSRSYETLAEMPRDVRGLPLGSAAFVRREISLMFPDTDWSDPVWGAWSGEPGSIEFNIGSDDPVESFMLHVRAGPEVVPGIVALCLRQGWQAIDCSDGTFLEKKRDAASGLNAWLSYRDRVVGQSSKAGTPEDPTSGFAEVRRALERARLALPDAALKLTSVDTAGHESIDTLESFDELMEQVEYEVACYSIAGIASASGAGAECWHHIEEAACLMRFGPRERERAHLPPPHLSD